MSQTLRVIASIAAFLIAITFAHGIINLSWFSGSDRPRLTIGHLPVT